MNDKIIWKNETRLLSDLKDHSKNPRKISSEQMDRLKASFEKFGYAETIALNADNTILAGHQRVRAMKLLRLTKDPIDVRVPSRQLTEKEADEYLIGSNLIKGDWDEDLLLLNWDATTLLEWGFSEDQIKKKKKKVAGEEDDFDTTPPESPVTVLGDIYELDAHKIVCGSATCLDTVKKVAGEEEIDLVITDPPYNVAYEGKTKDKLKIQNDSMGDKDFYSFLLEFYSNAFSVMKKGASIYVFHAESEGANFRRTLLESNLKLSQCLIWVKNGMVLGRQDYHWQHEPCLYGWKEGNSHKWYSDRKQTTIMNFDKPTRNAEHPTMKPIPLICYLINNSSQFGDKVFDFFMGSGTTLLACEQTGRIAYGTELDPKYCDVIVNRFIAYKKSKHESFVLKRNGEVITEL